MSEQKSPQQKGGPRGPGMHMPQMPQGDSFWVNLASSIFILLLLAGAYTYFAGDKTKPADIPISQLAADIQAGTVSKVLVDGNDLTITYAAAEGAEPVEKVSKKSPTQRCRKHSLTTVSPKKRSKK